MAKSVRRVRDVMKRQLDTVDGMTAVLEAARKMSRVETKTLIVDKRHEDDEYGRVVRSDIVREVQAKDRSPERVNVSEVMTKPAIHVPPDMNIRYCARLFGRFHLSRAPVVASALVIGVVRLSDLLMRGLSGGVEESATGAPSSCRGTVLR